MPSTVCLNDPENIFTQIILLLHTYTTTQRVYSCHHTSCFPAVVTGNVTVTRRIWIQLLTMKQARMSGQDTQMSFRKT